MSLIGSLALVLVRWRVGLLAICVLAGALALEPASRLVFDRRLESMFPPDDPRLVRLERARAVFGSLDNCVLVYADPQLISVAGLERLGRLTGAVAEVPGVRAVSSLANARRPAAPLEAAPLVQQLRSGKVQPDKLREELLGCQAYNGTFIGPDGATAVLLINLEPAGTAPVARGETIERLRQLAASHSPPAVLVGEPVLVHDVFAYLERDGKILSLTSTLLLSLVIATLFRNLRWLFLPLAVVQLSVVWTKAVLVLLGMQLSMVSSPLVALITVIGVATVVHVTMRYREERAGRDAADAVASTLRHVVPAVFWTCATTAAGFASLLASRLLPVRSFATMTALGTAMVFVAVLLLVPGVVLVGRRHRDPRPVPGEPILADALARLLNSVRQRPWTVALLSTALLAFAALGLGRLEVASTFTDNFRDSSRIVQAYKFVTERLGAVGSMDLLVEPVGALNHTSLAKLRQMQRELERVPGVVRTVSIADALDVLAARSREEDLLSRLGAAVLGTLPPSVQIVLLGQVAPGLVGSFWHENAGVLRVIVQVASRRGPEAKKELIRKVEQTGLKFFPGGDGHGPARAVGTYLLLTYMVDTLLADQWITFALASSSIFVLLCLAFRSVRLGLIAMVPNLAPILIVVGSMGWFGLPINIATAMLASVSMGLSVDFSIHYLYRYQQERQAGGARDESVRRAHASVGLAMVLASVALIVGFSVLTVSNFMPTVHFGILVSVAMLGGLAGNLVFLPLLLPIVERWPAAGRWPR